MVHVSRRVSEPLQPLAPAATEKAPPPDLERLFQLSQQDRESIFAASQLDRERHVQITELRRAHTFELAMLGWAVELEQPVASLSKRFAHQVLQVQDAQDGARQEFRLECDDMLQRATQSFNHATRDRYGKWMDELETAIVIVETGAAQAIAQTRVLLPELSVTPAVVQVAVIPAQTVDIDIGWRAYFQSISSSFV